MRFQNWKNKKGISLLFLTTCFTLVFYFWTIPINANTDLNQLNKQIEQKKNDLLKLDREIEAQRQLLLNTSGQANTLQSKINSLEASRKKLDSEIKKTQTEIDKAELVIQKLNSEISEKEEKINTNLGNLMEIIRTADELSKKSLIEKFLSYEKISDFWNDMENTLLIQDELSSEIEILLGLTENLKEAEIEKLNEKNTLAQFKTELSGQEETVELTKKEQQTILQKTKNQEAEYKKLLDQKIAEKQAFEKEILDIESQIKMIIDPKSFPSARDGVLAWPVDNIVITQLFGGSQFAKNNPGIYGRPFHPGVDFGVPVGTRVKSVAEGTVEGFGDTDAHPGCNAWGKWVLIRHDNGLSSMYAHLSSILVKQGQRVGRGDVIALSGNTGVSTGPHLHLTIYASQGVKIGKYSSYKSGGGCSATEATGPFADLAAYLDPMSYLPK
jgi:murein DD-endopeptidase MepM/ murein hydrolase activator NlpD